MRNWLFLVTFAVFSAHAHVVLVSHPYHWEEYWCGWSSDGLTVTAQCDDESIVDFETDPDNLFIARFDRYPGAWSYEIDMDGTAVYSGIGCVYWATTIDGDPNGAFLECP